MSTKEEWHRSDGHGSTLLYTLRQDGWRRGEPVMVNDVMIRIEPANGSDTDIEPIVERVMAALSSAPATKDKPEGVTDEIARYASRCREMSEGGKYEWWSRLAEILEAALPAGVRVKPLEWEPIGPADSDIEAKTELGTYVISVDSVIAGRTHYLWVAGQGESEEHHSDYTSMAHAKAAAQADYERRILSAIAPTQAPQGRWLGSECATEGCGNQAGVYFERGGVGTSYCRDCYMKVQALRTNGGDSNEA